MNTNYFPLQHSRYIVNSDNIYKLSNDNNHILDEHNQKIFNLFDIPTNSDLFRIVLEKNINTLQIIVNVNIELLYNYIQMGIHIPSRNIFFYLLQKNKINQHLITNIIDIINTPIINTLSKNIIKYSNNLNIDLYNYQIKNNEWMLQLENNPVTHNYISNNILKINNLFIDVEKERFLLDYKSNTLQINGGALIDSPGLGKCHLPNTNIFINNKIITSEQLWNLYHTNKIINDNEEIADCFNKLEVITVNNDTNNLIKTDISKLYRQKISENVKKVILSNGFEISITNKHKLLTKNGWTNNFTTNDYIALPSKFDLRLNNNKSLHNDLVKLILLHQFGYIQKQNNKMYIRQTHYSPFISTHIKIIVDIVNNVSKKILNNDSPIKYHLNQNYIIFKSIDVLKLIRKYNLNNIIQSSSDNIDTFVHFFDYIYGKSFYTNSYQKIMQLDIILKQKLKTIQIIKQNSNKQKYYLCNIFSHNSTSDIEYLKIDDIKSYHYEGWVYDYYVPEHNNYVANNIICHNTICMISLAQINKSKLDINCNNLSLDKIKLDDYHIKSRATLIIAPNHLCNQWKLEIKDKSTVNNRIILVTTKKEFDKTTYQDIVLADFVIVSLQFLNNNSFKNKWKEYHSCYHTSILDETIQTIASEYMRNPNLLQLFCPLFPLIHFHRLVIDECHELNNMKSHEYYYQIINLIKSDYRWCLSGTPFLNGNIDFYNILNILTYNKNSEYLLDKDIVKYIQYNIFRCNTNDSVKNEFSLKDINRKVFKLDFTIVEKMMYNSYKQLHTKSKFDLYLKQLCCHPNLANKTKDSLINCKTLDDISTGMIGYNEKMYNKYNVLLTEYNKELESENLDKKKKTTLIKKQQQTKISINTCNNNIKYFKEIIPVLSNKTYDTCSICLNNISDDTLSMTKCGHLYCYECIYQCVNHTKKCPMCRIPLSLDTIYKINLNNNNEDKSVLHQIINKYGTKIAHLITFLQDFIQNTNERCIIFSQFDKLLSMIGKILSEYSINNIFCKGNVMQKNNSIDNFKFDDNYRVFMLSVSNTASGLNLSCASTVIFLEPIYGSNEYILNTEKQAISRIYRIGQQKDINVIHFIIKNTIEEEVYDDYMK